MTKSVKDALCEIYSKGGGDLKAAENYLLALVPFVKEKDRALCQRAAALLDCAAKLKSGEGF